MFAAGEAERVEGGSMGKGQTVDQQGYPLVLIFIFLLLLGEIRGCGCCGG